MVQLVPGREKETKMWMFCTLMIVLSLAFTILTGMVIENLATPLPELVCAILGACAVIVAIVVAGIATYFIEEYCYG